MAAKNESDDVHASAWTYLVYLVVRYPKISVSSIEFCPRFFMCVNKENRLTKATLGQC